MEINLRTLKGCYVYKTGATQPWGVVSNARIGDSDAKVNALLVDTLSIIPLSYLIDINDIESVKERTVYLKRDCSGMRYIRKEIFTAPERLSCIQGKNGRIFRLRDIKFDMESGEISEITVSKTVFAKKNKISINNIFIKDNTIYIE